MKEEFENQTIDMEHVLRDKSWNQLSDEERKLAGELFSGEGEYERVRNMVHGLRAGSGIQEEELQPSENVRRNLLDAFDDEQRRRRVLWWNSLGFWLRDRLRLDIPAVRLALTGVVLILGIVALLQLTGNENSQPVIAKKETPKVIPPNQNEGQNKGLHNPEPEEMNRPLNNYAWLIPQPQITPPVVEQEEENIVSPAPEEPQQIAKEEVPVNESFENVNPTNDGSLPVPVDSSLAGIVASADDTTLVSPVVINFMNATTCIGASNGNITTITSGVTAPFTYSWIPADGTPSYALSPSNYNLVVINDMPPNCRSLANDMGLISSMFSLR